MPFIFGAIRSLHAEFRLKDDELELVDLNSTNGTFVNEDQLTPMEPRHLRHGDTIRFGDQRFLFEEQP
jgi:pSer/pThr/pTyr-binding forkhead associated (FHA) protein